jgi:hypothetical protein
LSISTLVGNAPEQQAIDLLEHGDPLKNHRTSAYGMSRRRPLQKMPSDHGHLRLSSLRVTSPLRRVIAVSSSADWPAR